MNINIYSTHINSEHNAENSAGQITTIAVKIAVWFGLVVQQLSSKNTLLT